MSHVKCNTKVSASFSWKVGVWQGENLSPILFAIYLNYFKAAMSKNCKDLNVLANEMQDELDVFLHLYVYADDTIIII